MFKSNKTVNSMFEILSPEEQMKITLITGNCLVGFFKAAAVGLKVGGVALKASATAMRKTADIADAGGDIAIAYSNEAEQKAAEHTEALALCERLLNTEKHQAIV